MSHMKSPHDSADYLTSSAHKRKQEKKKRRRRSPLRSGVTERSPVRSSRRSEERRGRTQHAERRKYQHRSKSPEKQHRKEAHKCTKTNVSEYDYGESGGQRGQFRSSPRQQYEESARLFNKASDTISEDYQNRRDEGIGRRNSSPQNCDMDASVSRNREHPSPAVADYDFDWESHRSTLSKVFFTDEDVIKRNTEEFRDFWVFLKKYQTFQKKKAALHKEKKSSTTKVSKLEVPHDYDKRYRINVSLKRSPAQHCASKEEKDENALTRDRISAFRSIILHYLDFCQKQKFAKLVKIKKDQMNLPIYQYKNVIISTIKSHQVTVVAGDTGCGKSTQVPQYLLEAGFEKIACTQPRRIACISLSKRVGYETLNEYGSQVAFQVRFEKNKTQNTRILFLTEGLLLRKMSSDAALSQYSVIVIDEVHERHIHTDFLLGVLKCLISQRPELKIVMMSATINISLFSHYFEDAPVVKVPGRLYPIQLQYCPITVEDKTDRFNPGPYIRVLQNIDHKYPRTERGDLLIFLSGMTEIVAVVEAAKLYAQESQNWVVLPLHSALSVAEQDKVFDIAPDGARKCIVSTNIAETSVTIDGVRFIIDSGKVKEMSFDSNSKMQRLQEFWISRASAEQRKGRAGRTGPGVCFRLYSESDYDEFQEYATPEIQRVPLDALVLQMMAMGLPDARKFPFIEAPAMASIENSIAMLTDQHALSADEELTPIGQMLSQLPVDVVIGKMLIMGSVFHMADPVLSVAAALSVQSPFTSRAHTDYDAMNARKPLESEHGDPFTLLNAFDEWIQVKAEGRGTRKWCRRRGLEEQRFYEMSKLKQQFKDLLQEHNLLLERESEQRYYTSTERQKQHADRRQLAQLKRKQRNENRKRKVLKLHDQEFGLSDGDDKDDDDENEPDIKDLEFRLSHDLDHLQERSNRSRSFTLRDINLMKLILCSGLYPQVAIADEHNSFKSDSEQAFHTKSKPFVLLHPTSVFISKPELLQLKQQDVKTEGLNETKRPFSSKHQLLAYVSLLETTKPYLVSTMRVPALQTATLYANSVDTNEDCTRIVCDGWLELCFDDVDAAHQVITSLIQLRATWQQLLHTRLQDTVHKVEDGTRRNPRGQRLEKVLARKLPEYLQSDVSYSMRRILPAENQHLYRGPEQEFKRNEVFNVILKESGEPHPTKGGIKVNDFLNYNCLQDDSAALVWGEYTSCMQKHWTCERCGQSLIVTVLERLQHQAQCADQAMDLSKEDEATEHEEAQKQALRKPYSCPVCQCDYQFTTTEALKHRKSCTNPADLSRDAQAS